MRHVHSLVTISGHLRLASCFYLHVASTYTLLHLHLKALLPTTMQGPSKETVRGKRKFRDKLKDGVKGIFKLSLSRAPSPQPIDNRGDSSKEMVRLSVLNLTHDSQPMAPPRRIQRLSGKLGTSTATLLLSSVNGMRITKTRNGEDLRKRSIRR